MATFDNWLTVTDPRLMAEALAEQFRLSQNELQKASEALAPAFAIGMQRAMADPAAWADLTKAFGAMVPMTFGSPQQTNAGPAFLDAFFRSDALVGAVARQASLFAGIAPDVMQKLMPGLAMLSMDQSLRAAMDTLRRTQPAGLATGDFGGATAEMMRRGANAVEALSRPSDAPIGKQPTQASPFAGNPMTDAFAEAMKTGMSWFQRSEPQSDKSEETQAPKRTRDKPAEKAAPKAGGARRQEAAVAKDAKAGADAFNPILPFAMMMEAFAKGIASVGGTPVDAKDAGKPQPDAKVEAETPPDAGILPDAMPPPEPPLVKSDAIVGEIMRSGQKIQDDYAREMAALFERYQGELKVGH